MLCFVVCSFVERNFLPQILIPFVSCECNSITLRYSTVEFQLSELRLFESLIIQIAFRKKLG